MFSWTQNLAWMKQTAMAASLLVLSGCNLGSVDFKTKDPGTFSGGGGDSLVLAKNLSFSGVNLVEAGECTAITIHSEANNGSIHPVTMDVPIQLGLATGAGAKFYAGQTECQGDSSTSVFGTLSEVTLAAGQSEVSFYVRSLGTAPFTIVALSEQLGFNSFPLNVQSTPKKLVFTLEPASVDGGRCSNANRYRVEVRDGLNNPLSGTNLNVALSASVGGTFSLSCGGSSVGSVTLGLASRLFYFSTDAVQTTTITAEVAGNGDIEPAIHNLSVNGVADNFTLTRPAVDAPLGECSPEPLTVTIRDSANAALANHGGQSIEIQETSGSARFYTSQAACQADTSNSAGGNGSLQTTVSNGSATRSIYFRPNQTVSAGSSATSLSLRVRVEHRDDAHFADQLSPVISVSRAPKSLALSGPASVAAGVCSAPFTAVVRDRMGVRFGDTGLTINLLEGGDGQYYSNISCSNAVSGPLAIGASGQRSFYFKPGSIASDIPIEIEAANLTGVSGASTTVDAVASTQGVRITAPAGPLALGKCIPVTLETLDANGDVVTGDHKNIEVTYLSGVARAFAPSNSCSNDPIGTTTEKDITLLVNGTKTIYIRPTSVSNLTIQAKIQGESPTDTTDPLAVNRTVESLALDGPDNYRLNVGLCARFELEIRDGLGQLYGSHGGLVVSFPTTNNASYYDGDCANPLAGEQLSIANGASTAVFHLLPTAEELGFVVNAETGAVTSNNISVTFVDDAFALHTDFLGSGSGLFNLSGTSADEGVDVLLLPGSKLLVVAKSSDGGMGVGLIGMSAEGAVDFKKRELLGAEPVAAVANGNGFLVAANQGGQMVLARFLNDGTVDTGFNGTGSVGSAFAGTVEAVDVVDVAGGASFVVVGTQTDGANENFCFMQVDSDGTVVSETVVAFGANENRADRAAWDGSSLYMAGLMGATDPELVVVRTDLAGNLDTSFNGDGTFVLNYLSNPDVLGVRDLLVVPEGLLVMSAFDDGLSVSRIIDSGFDPGYTTSGYGISSVIPNGRLLADPVSNDVLKVINGNDYFSIWREEADGTFVTSNLFTSLAPYSPNAFLAFDNGQVATVGTSGTAVRVTRHLP